MMDAIEVRMRCIEAAAKNPTPHNDGFPTGTLESAKMWAEWVLPGPETAPKLTKIKTTGADSLF